MTNATGTKKTGSKKSFNFEQDVEEMFGRWKVENPGIIESRLFNNAMRAALAPYKKRTKKVSA